MRGSLEIAIPVAPVRTGVEKWCNMSGPARAGDEKYDNSLQQSAQESRNSNGKAARARWGVDMLHYIVLIGAWTEAVQALSLIHI